MLNSAVAKHDERERRKQNIMVFGLAMQNANNEEDQRKDDEEALNKLLSSVGIDTGSLVSFRRFRAKPSNVPSSPPPPILLKLADGVNRIHVLAAAKKLRCIKGYERVFINQDMTDSERVLDRQLRQKRDELNKSEAENNQPFRWAIRGTVFKRFATFTHRQQRDRSQGSGVE